MLAHIQTTINFSATFQRQCLIQALVAYARAHSWDAAVDAVLEELGRLAGAGGPEPLPGLPQPGAEKHR